ncbi:MAG: thioredoxin domain-containing protein [Nitrospinaceae bacterium]|nr:thioredoxin domain-containing protein [Nitrospinaceae bacterium]MBT3432935.1 thioredoxin domain-containing protein [Nitrospinaceae bacterium]MBT3822951.1 thioredoxin domain-containing protein [Nitrospinaceae bacterium]MBT4094524.1 thioredoxin domain-containing protein [Nitrospinaceae bacterium]MBT4430140.1 thioredoxin domain-containing protein [Nitrospinaceae bacterium]
MGGTPEIEKDPDVQVEWVSWEGRPPGQEFAGYSPEHKVENYKTNHKPLADKYDVPINLAGGNYRTTNAHMATFYARDMGKFKDFRDRIYKARWEDDLALDNPDVLAKCGEDVGLDGEEIKKVIAEKRYLAALHSQRAQGKSLGIFGIPSFVVQGKIFWGKDVIDDVKAEVSRLKKKKIVEQEKQDG